MKRKRAETRNAKVYGRQSEMRRLVAAVLRMGAFFRLRSDCFECAFVFCGSRVCGICGRPGNILERFVQNQPTISGRPTAVRRPAQKNAFGCENNFEPKAECFFAVIAGEENEPGPLSLANQRYDSGLTLTPFFRTSKCRCHPYAQLPDLPETAIACPLVT